MNQTQIKPIPEYEHYYVDSLGNVYSDLKTGFHQIKPVTTPFGYKIVWLYKKGFKRRKAMVHRLVMKAFIGDNDLCVNHINGIKYDNRLENLEYCTTSENVKHAYDTGLKKQRIGEKHMQAKLSEMDIITIKLFYNNGLLGAVKLAEKFNVSRDHITRIARGATWKHLN